jgi:heat-inducible transcriptional repressor
MSLDDRKLEVLRAIVEDYVKTHEPVGSKALVERHQLGVSSATVRNDMAVLEEEGYIRQPHTSAGRVPTDAGYRLFVDRLTRIKPLTPAERRAIERFMVGVVDLDDVVHRTVRLLAQLTRQVAVVQYPSLSRSTVRHLELVPISTTRLMVVMITDTGRVEQRLVEMPGPVPEGDEPAGHVGLGPADGQGEQGLPVERRRVRRTEHGHGLPDADDIGGGRRGRGRGRRDEHEGELLGR